MIQGKGWILAPILCLAFTVPSSAQENPKPLLLPPLKLELVFPIQPVVLGPVEHRESARLMLEKAIAQREATQKPVCSVPLLEARVEAKADSRMAYKPADSSVAIPKASVPAPACEKK